MKLRPERSPETVRTRMNNSSLNQDRQIRADKKPGRAVGKNRTGFLLMVFLFAACGLKYVGTIGPRYYRLSESEKKIFLGMRGVDSSAAYRYLDLKNSADRALLYDSIWSDRDEERNKFEDRIDFAYREFGRYEPLLDDRIPVYAQYGMPAERTSYTPQKLQISAARETVKPAEIWTYKKEGREFDFVKTGRAFRLIARSEFGERVQIPFLVEDSAAVDIGPHQVVGNLVFNLAYGRFRQEMNLTRLELYADLNLSDTTGVSYLRGVQIYESMTERQVEDSYRLLRPKGGEKGLFHDEVNIWLKPGIYRIVYEIFDQQQYGLASSGRKEFSVDLLEYAEGAKEISDLVPARLIDRGFTDERFRKPAGRLIPYAGRVMPVSQPFYFYHEVYNLGMRDSLHQLRTSYEVYNKDKMKKEIIDIMIQDEVGKGDVAYLAMKYHPMDLPPGHYIIIARDTDMLSGKERSTIFEFELTAK